MFIASILVFLACFSINYVSFRVWAGNDFVDTSSKFYSPILYGFGWLGSIALFVGFISFIFVIGGDGLLNRGARP